MCDGFLRYDPAQRVDEVSGSPDRGRRSAAADQAVAESATAPVLDSTFPAVRWDALTADEVLSDDLHATA